MKTKIFTFSAASTALALALFISSCGGNLAPLNQTSNSSPNLSADCPNAPCAVEKKSPESVTGKKIICQNPVIAAAGLDQSGSMRWTGTNPISANDLKPLLELITACGGEIGITFVRSNSAKPIERLRIDEPPPALAEPVQKPDEEDYEFADRMDEFKQNVTEREQVIQKNRQAVEPPINDYLNNLAPLLAQKPKGGTDLWTSLNRLDVFLSESNESWRVKPHRYLIIVSDGENTVGQDKRPLKSEATVIWVNASAADKRLKDFPYLRVESFAAAVREILAREGVK